MAVSDRSGWHLSEGSYTLCVVSRGLSLRSSCVFLFGWEIVRMMYMHLWKAHLDLNSNFVNLPKEINDFNSLRNWFLKRFYGFVTTNCGCSLCVSESVWDSVVLFFFFGSIINADDLHWLADSHYNCLFVYKPSSHFESVWDIAPIHSCRHSIFAWTRSMFCTPSISSSISSV